MKFGKQLALGMYLPWTMFYLQYGRLKRIIKRKVFISDKTDDCELNSKYYEVLDNIIEKQSNSMNINKDIEMTDSTPLLNDKDIKPVYI